MFRLVADAINSANVSPSLKKKLVGRQNKIRTPFSMNSNPSTFRIKRQLIRLLEEFFNLFNYGVLGKHYHFIVCLYLIVAVYNLGYTISKNSSYNGLFREFEISNLFTCDL